MRNMKDSGIEWIGEIPEIWEVVKVKNLYTNNKYIVGDKVNDYERLALTLNGVIKRSKDDSDGLQPQKFEGYQVLKENELVFKLIDLENINTSRVGLSPYTGIVSPAYIVLNNKNESRFGYYYFLSMWHREIFNKLGGSGVRSNLNSNDLLNLPYLYINHEEQELIADYLDKEVKEIDTIISKTQETIEEYKKYKQSVITEAVTKGLNHNVEMKDSGIEWIGKIPRHWKVVSLKKLVEIKDGTHDTPLYVEESESSFPLVTSKDFKNDEINFESVKFISKTDYDAINIRSKVDSGDVLMSMIGGNIGKTIIVKNRNNFAIKNVALFKTNTNKYLAQILSCYLQSELLQTQVRLKSRGGAQEFIGLNDIRNLIYFDIPQKEQKQIAIYLNKKCTQIDNLILQKQNLILELEQYKKSLIYEYVTGKKEVAVAYGY